MAKTAYDIRRELYSRYSFEDCIIERITSLHYGASLEILFDYLWADESGAELSRGVWRRREGDFDKFDPSSSRKIVLRLLGVQEMHLRGDLGSTLLLAPEKAGRGLGEIAFLELEQDDLFLSAHQHIEVPLHHLCLRWHGYRRLDIVFADLVVEEAKRP